MIEAADTINNMTKASSEVNKLLGTLASSTVQTVERIAVDDIALRSDTYKTAALVKMLVDGPELVNLFLSKMIKDLECSESQ